MAQARAKDGGWRGLQAHSAEGVMGVVVPEYRILTWPAPSIYTHKSGPRWGRPDRSGHLW